MKQRPSFAIIPKIFISTLLLIAFGCRDNASERQMVRPVAVRVVRPIIKDMENRLLYLGTVRANREVKVISQVQGTVSSLPKSEGASVDIGDLVVELEVPDIRANVDRIQADLDYWQRKYEADQRLVAANALPSEQMEASLRAYRSASAALAEVEAKLAKAKEFSAIKGQVLSWLLEPGQHVMPGQPILLLGNDEIEIHVEVVEEDLRKGITFGIPVNIIDWRENKFPTTVTELAPVASTPARTFTVKMPFPTSTNHIDVLRVGTSMQVEFILGSTDSSITVPIEAIYNQGGHNYIYIVRNDRTEKQQVKTGIEQDGRIEVMFPWNGEDRVAVSNLSSLEDNMPVYAVELEKVIR